MDNETVETTDTVKNAEYKERVKELFSEENMNFLFDFSKRIKEITKVDGVTFDDVKAKYPELADGFESVRPEYENLKFIMPSNCPKASSQTMIHMACAMMTLKAYGLVDIGYVMLVKDSDGKWNYLKHGDQIHVFEQMGGMLKYHESMGLNNDNFDWSQVYWRPELAHAFYRDPVDLDDGVKAKCSA